MRFGSRDGAKGRGAHNRGDVGVDLEAGPDGAWGTIAEPNSGMREGAIFEGNGPLTLFARSNGLDQGKSRGGSVPRSLGPRSELNTLTSTHRSVSRIPQSAAFFGRGLPPPRLKIILKKPNGLNLTNHATSEC